MSAATGKLRLSAEAEARIDDLQGRYPNKRATTRHVLWEVQNQNGWISTEWMAYVAERCEVPVSHIMSVVTFYTMFRSKPVGRHHIEVCRNISCHIMGARRIIDRVKEVTGLSNHEVSADGKLSFEEVECLAGCCWAPMMAINGAFHENLTPAKAEEILKGLE
jgi:NADH-quinone oxidoreductase E subunit